MGQRRNSPVDLHRELAGFAEGLVVQNFKALSSGVGIGSLEEKREEPRPIGSIKVDAQAISSMSRGSYSTGHLNDSAFNSSFKKTSIPKVVQKNVIGGEVFKDHSRLNTSGSDSNLDRLFANTAKSKPAQKLINPLSPLKTMMYSHLIDLLFSGAAAVLTVGLIGALMTLDGGTASMPQQAMKLVESLSALHMVGGVYLSYALYALVFKLFAGMTVGEQIINGKFGKS